MTPRSACAGRVPDRAVGVRPRDLDARFERRDALPALHGTVRE
jgi:hypothetical protein